MPCRTCCIGKEYPWCAFEDAALGRTFATIGAGILDRQTSCACDGWPHCAVADDEDKLNCRYSLDVGSCKRRCFCAFL
jgi:hypothetical protein